MLFGNVQSIVSVSFEKRFTIRPKGVMSKNSPGERRMFLSMSMCISLAARIVPTVMTTVAAKPVRPVVTEEISQVYKNI